MSDVKDLTKLNREQLNEFASQNGIDNASDESVYPTKADLAKELSGRVTPEQLEAYRSEGEDQAGSEGEDQGSGEGQDQGQDQSSGQGNDQAAQDEISSQSNKTAEDPATQVGGGTDRTAPTETQTNFSDRAPLEGEEDAEAEDESPAAASDESASDDEEETAPTTAGGVTPQTKAGFGWPRKNGKTVDIFTGKPYTHIKYVGGHMVPLTEETYNGKTDSEILKQVEKTLQ